MSENMMGRAVQILSLFNDTGPDEALVQTFLENGGLFLDVSRRLQADQLTSQELQVWLDSPEVRQAPGGAPREIDIRDLVKSLTAKGLHKVALAPDGQTRGMKAAVYRKLWPKIVTQPSEYAGRFDQVLLVDTTIEAAALIEHGNVVQGINPDSCHDLVDQPKDEQGNPLKRYVAFIQLGEKNLGRSVMGCRDSFAQDELGLTTREGLHLPIEHADYLRQYAVDLAGSGYGEVCAPCVYWFGSVQPELYRSHVGHRYSSYGSASRGSVVIAVD